jgi:acyl-coenzyme A synthetase/AMP-(fatty) acid ligase
MPATKPQVPLLPPLDGSITVLPGLIDFHAQQNPDQLCAIWPSTSSPGGTTGVTFSEFSDASHRLAHILRPNREGKDGEIVGVIIQTDVLLYMAVLAGMLRAGFVVCAAIVLNIFSIRDTRLNSHSRCRLAIPLLQSSISFRRPTAID